MKVNALYLRPALLSVFISITAITGNAQFAQSDIPTFPRRQIRLSAGGLMYQRLQLHHKAEPLLRSRHTFSGMVGLHYYEQLWETWGLEAGAGFSVAPMNLYIPNFLSLDSATNNVRIEEEGIMLDSYIYDAFTYSLSAAVEKVFPSDLGHYYFISAGARLNMLLYFPYETNGAASFFDGTQQDAIIDFFNYNLENQSHKQAVGYFLKLGLIKPTGKHTLQVNAIVHYSPDNIATGNYRFHRLPFESHGTLEWGINYVGLEITRGFTLSGGNFGKR